MPSYYLCSKELRKALKKCKPSFSKEMGLDALKKMKWIEGKNPAMEAKYLDEARFHLQFAKG